MAQDSTWQSGVVAAEALPQRAPRARKRVKLEVETVETVAGKTCTTIFACNRNEDQAQGDAEGAQPSTSHPDILPGSQYEYMDHTADIQLHAWGETMEQALASLGLCMYNYMTPLEGIRECADDPPRTFTATGHDLHSLLFAFLDELLYVFNTEFFVCRTLRVTRYDLETYTLEAEGRGETFDRVRHMAGTEIKAITYSAMQVVETAARSDLYVIVDI